MISIKNVELQIFFSVCKYQSFSKAAHEMKISQAQISKYISSLESKLGTVLFERGVRPVTLTIAGKELFPYIRNCINSNEDLIQFVEKNKKLDEGVVNIFSPSGVQAMLAKHVLPSIESKGHNICISMTTWNQADNDLSKGIDFNENCDILISYALPKDENLIARKFRTINFNIYATKGVINRFPIKTIDDFSDVPFILLPITLNDNNRHYVTFINTHSKEITKVEISGRYFFDNSMTAVHACKSELGYFLSSPYLIDDDALLTPQVPDKYIIEMPCYAIYKRRVNQPSRIKFVIDHIIDNFSQAI